MSTDFDALGLMIRCTFCKAWPGQWCVVRGTDRDATYLHGRRMEPILLAWRAGWDQRTNDLMRWHMADHADFLRYAARWTRANVGPTP